MKKYIFSIYLAIVLLLGISVFTVIYNYRTHNNFENWKQCIEASSYSDSECEECDYLYNRDGKFDLSKYNSENGSIDINDVSFIQWETCIKIALDNGTNCNACDVYNPKGLDFQTDLLH